MEQALVPPPRLSKKRLALAGRFCYTLRVMKDHSHEEDVDFEPEEGLGDLGAATAKIKKLRDELEKVKTERQEYLDGWQRSKADSVNTRREALAAGERLALRTKENMLEDLLPALDSFDMAASSPAWESIAPEWRAGMDQVRNQLHEMLSRHGVERFGEVGDLYSPHLHEAVQETNVGGGEPGSVVRLLRFGYKIGDRVIRPAQVVIKKHTE